MLSVGPKKKEAALLKLGLLPMTSWRDAMCNFKGPTKPTDGAMRSNPNDVKDWNAEVQRAKLVYVRDTPFPNRTKHSRMVNNAG